MRTAVLVSGQMRSLDLCMPSIEKFILRRIGEFDIIAHIADDEDSWKINLLNPCVCKVTKQPEIDEKNYVHRSGRGVIGIQPVLRMFWSMEESNRLKIAEENRLGRKYDWVIRLRPDTQFFSEIENLNDCDPSCVYIPTFCNFWGYQDRFAFGGSEVMDTYHNKMDLVDEYIESGGIFHPESILKWVIDRSGIAVKRTNLVFDTLRKNGQRIRPEWQEYYCDVIPHRSNSLETSVN